MANEEQKELVKVIKELNDFLKQSKTITEDLNTSFKETSNVVVEVNEAVKNLGPMLEKTKKGLEGSRSQLESSRDLWVQIQKVNEELALKGQEMITEGEKRILGFDKSLERQTKLLQIDKDQLKSIQEAIKLKKKEGLLIKENGVETKHGLPILKAEQEYVKNIVRKLQERIEEQKKFIIDAYKRENIEKETNQYMESQMQKFGISTNYQKTWLGYAERTLGTTGGLSAAFTQIGLKMKDVANPANLFSMAVSKIAFQTFEMAKEMDFAFSGFNKATGTAGQYSQVIDDVRFGSLSAGVGIKVTTDAVKALFLNLSSFNSMSKETQENLTRTTALFNQMGISSEVTAQNLDIATQSLDMTIDQAMRSQKEIAAVAMKVGIAPQKMAQQFAASIPKLAAYGKESIKVFKELAIQSKATGISMDGLLGITEQFDTFEGAATAAGKLNAMLGGNLLSSVDLLNASESERIKLLQDAVKGSGQSWESLDRFDKKAIAAAAGIKDLDEANRLFGTNSQQAMEKSASAADVAALSQKQLLEQAQASTSAQAKLLASVEALTAGAKPLLDMVNYLIEGFTTFSNYTGGFLGPALIGVTGILYGVVSVMGMLSTAGLVTGATLAAAFWPVTLTLLTIVGAIAAIIHYKDKIKSIFGGIGAPNVGRGAAGPEAVAAGYNFPTHEFASGIDNFSGGMAMVGEKGPEIVSLPQGTNVINNSNSSRLSESINNVNNARTESYSRSENINRNISQSGGSSNNTSNNSQGSSNSPMNVYLMLDGRELGRAIINTIDKEIKLNMVGV